MATSDPAGYNYGVTVGQQVVKQIGGAWTPQKQRFFDAWAKAEGTKAAYNPFATTRHGYAGETDFNSVGVKNYTNLRVGIQATADTLQNGYYNHIVDLLRDPSATAEDLAKAVAASPWGTGTGVLRVLGADPSGYEAAKQANALTIAATAKENTTAASAESAAQYGALRGDVEATYHEIELTPSASYLQQLAGRSAFGARLAGVAQRAEESFAAARASRAAQFTPAVAASGAAQTGAKFVPATPPTTDSGEAPTAPNPVINRVLQIADAQVGKPYVWGGETPQEGGFDCSGLIDYAFSQAGVDIPGRLTTYTAAKLGKSVMGQKLQPGDWVISNGGEHMTMYVGDGRVIAAPHKGENVQYQKLSDFQGKIVDIRRFPATPARKEK